MNWISIDPSNTAGIAYWQDGQLISTTVCRRVGAKGRYAVGGDMFPTRWLAWNAAINGNRVAIVEEGFGRFATAVKSQAGIREYIHAVCDYMSSGLSPITFRVVNVKEWRRVIKEAYNVSWPSGRVDQKALSVRLVNQHFGLTVADDEADAVLLGVAAMRMGLVNVGGAV